MTRATRRFWGVTNFTLNPRLEADRWGMEMECDLESHLKIMRDDGFIDVPPLVAHADRMKPIEDAPIVFAKILVVSDRVRNIFESIGKNDCQCIPIDIRHRGVSLNLSYWVIHVLRTIDCVDLAASTLAPDKESQSGPFYYRFQIDSTRVPPETSIFRVRHCGMFPVVRDSLRRALKRAKVTGLDFYAT